MRDHRRWHLPVARDVAWLRLTDAIGWARAWPAVREARSVSEGVQLALGGPRPLTVVLELDTQPADGLLVLRFVRGELRHLDARAHLREASNQGCWLEASVELAFPVVIPASLERELVDGLLPSWVAAVAATLGVDPSPVALEKTGRSGD